MNSSTSSGIIIPQGFSLNSEMITTLFWNTSGNRVPKIIAHLAQNHNVDILVLAECTSPIVEMLYELNNERDLGFHASPSNCERIVVFSRFPNRFILPILESPYITIRHICPPGIDGFLLACAHLRSKLYQRPGSQTLECTVLSDEIQLAEKLVGTEKTVLVGDLNMNPFEEGVAGARGLHAVMTRERASRQKRTVAGYDYKFFYNPMWGFFGDLSGGPAGSYHYESSEQVEYFWNIFDQVLVRPSLLEYFDIRDLRILTGDEHIRLLNEKGFPDKNLASDHLPVIFSLNI